jgi:hypothetical protein
VFASPVASGGFIFCGFAVMASAEIRTTLRILMFGEITVVAVAIRNFFDFVSFFT